MASSSARLRSWMVLQKLEARNQISPRGGCIMMRNEDAVSGNAYSASFGEVAGEYKDDFRKLTVS